MATGDKWQVTASSLNIRNGPGTSYSVVGGLQKGSIVTEVGSSGNWTKIDKGYVSSQYLTSYSKAEVTTVTENPTDNGVTDQSTINETSGLDSDGGSGYRPMDEVADSSNVEELKSTISEGSSFYDINTINAVFGLPYQFLPTADVRLSPSDSMAGQSIGAEYADRIVGKMPILFIAPGRASFMTKYSDDEQSTIMERALKKGLDVIDNTVTSLSDLLNNDGRYYTFEYQLTEYYQFVNPMCAIAARYLDLTGAPTPIGSLESVSWYDYIVGHSSSIFNSTAYLHIPFYIDTDTSVSEDFDNTIGESSLASSVNGISDLGRELNFLTGYTGQALDIDWLQQNADILSDTESLNEMVESILGKGNFLTNLTKHLNTVASGGRLLFPKIWSDSGFARSYNVKVKLVSPDCSKLSIYLNILVPLFHLIGFVAPQMLSDNPNGYLSPFIVRAIYKSFFNVDSGIITNMSVEKGGNCLWTVDGLPTSIEVNFTIKDLYEVMGITKSSAGNLFGFDTMSNTAQMDYIANLCGINIYKPEIARQLDMYLMSETNKVTALPGELWTTMNQTIGSCIMNIFGR